MALDLKIKINLFLKSGEMGFDSKAKTKKTALTVNYTQICTIGLKNVLNTDFSR